MSSSSAPGGLSLKAAELLAVEIGKFLWGTAQGAFNEKQTLPQIITDAGIGMIPVVGDVTAIRDLVAVSLGLATKPEKREHVMEWVLLVIFVFALIPVLGGVIKGVGRVALRVGADVARDTEAIAKIAHEVLEFLNRIGHGNEQLWLKTMDVMKYEKELITKFSDFCDMIIISIHRYGLRFSAILPQSMISRMEQISNGFKQIKELIASKLPEGLKVFQEKLKNLQELIHNGGVPPIDKAKTLAVQTGQKTVTYAEEARLIESGAAKKIVHGGTYAQNAANADAKFGRSIDEVYKHKAGFPDLKDRVETVGGVSYYPKIAASSGPIKNELLEGETLFRAFGEKGSTHGVEVGKSNPIGPFWGRGAPPKTAAEWRKKYAVIDEWNRNGWLSMVHIPPGVKIPACTSTVSEQFSKKIGGQFLEGGGQQAVVTAFFEKQILELTDQLYKRGGGKATIAMADGKSIIVEVKQSGWKGINGKIGYGETVIPGAAKTERLGVTEIQEKVSVESVKQSAAAGAAKEQRASENRKTLKGT
ncbi:putative conserved hypothetical protein [Collimonas fungivorans]|uniref:Uncharacterized protein n=1 Tax=Collimonas fungivorans TaxID=158899 RepID=A0A127PCI4_9BURK|nr:hypothetical protein [Collimonas fungivorans]AMO95530.1 putative conserved hypothetical protein [Collimonas fungivorans]